MGLSDDDLSLGGILDVTNENLESDDEWNSQVEEILQTLDEFSVKSKRKEHHLCKKDTTLHNHQIQVDQEERQIAADWASRMRQALLTWKDLKFEENEEAKELRLKLTSLEGKLEEARQLPQRLENRIRDLDHDLKMSLQHHLQVQTQLHETIDALKAENTELQVKLTKAVSTATKHATSSTETSFKESLQVKTKLDDEETPPPTVEPSPLPQQTEPPTPFRPRNAESQSRLTTEPTRKPTAAPRRRRSFVDEDGTRHIVYQHGAQKLVQSDGTTVVYHTNGDVEGEGWYFFHATQTWQRHLDDGSVVWEYSNGQIETHTGTHKRVQFPDGTFYEFTL